MRTIIAITKIMVAAYYFTLPDKDGLHLPNISIMKTVVAFFLVIKIMVIVT